MTILGITALSSLAMAVALAGCSCTNQSSDTEYRQQGGSYMANSSIGPVMTTLGGRTVYTFNKDQPGKSNCYEACAKH